MTYRILIAAALAAVALAASPGADAITRLTPLQTPDGFPEIEVARSPGGTITWKLTARERFDLVILTNMTYQDARQFRANALTARDQAREIEATGGCAGGKAEGPVFGRIRSPAGDHLSFRVQCEDGITRVWLSVADEYLVHHVVYPVGVEDLVRVGEALVEAVAPPAPGDGASR